MARSDIGTLLELDEYARIMAMPGWHFNQITRTDREFRGLCDDLLVQSGYFVDPTRIVGRDEIAQAIAVAERQVAAMLHYWPAPKYICADEIAWPVPRRGTQLTYPPLRLNWGKVVEVGIEAWDLIVENLPVVYSVRSGLPAPPSSLDWATVTYAAVPAVAGICELVIVPSGYDPAAQEWRIRPLNVTLVGTTVTFTGWRWQFVLPPGWLEPTPISLDDNAMFIQGGIYDGGVDLYRHYTDATSQAQLVWKNGTTCDAVCAEGCVPGCVTIDNSRVGLVVVKPATWSSTTGLWTLATCPGCGLPNSARVWYLAGYDDSLCVNCAQMGPQVKEAIVRLANCHLPEAPCGCDPTRGRWERDREEMAVDSMDVELAQSAFGTTMRGAVFAYNVFSKLPPLGQGG